MTDIIWKDSPVAFAAKQRRKPDDDEDKRRKPDDDKRRKPDDDKRRKPDDDKRRGKPDDDKQRRKPDEEKQEDVTIVEGYITTYGNVDNAGDVIQRGALDGFIEDFNNGEVMLRMLFQHQRNQIIGQWTELQSDEFGVFATGEIFEDIQLGADIATLVRRGLLDSFSIGFVADENGFEQRRGGGRLFTEIRLVETSVVDVPANSRARITEVRADDGSLDYVKIEKLLRDAGLSRTESKTAVYAMKQPLRDAEEVEQKNVLYSNILSKLGGTHK